MKLTLFHTAAYSGKALRFAWLLEITFSPEDKNIRELYDSVPFINLNFCETE